MISSFTLVRASLPAHADSYTNSCSRYFAPSVLPQETMVFIHLMTLVWRRGASQAINQPVEGRVVMALTLPHPLRV